MRIGFLFGGLSSLQPTFAGVYLAWAAHRRGHEACFVAAEDLSFLDDGSVLATTLRVRAGDYDKPADFYRALVSSDAVREADILSGFDVVFIRYNPLREPHSAPPSPILDFCWRLRLGGTFVVNDPEGVFRAWGRLYLSDLPPDVHARTLVSRSPDKIKAFLRDLDGPAVLKPLAHAGREKVFRVERGQVKNLNPILTAITKDGYAVAQEYLREAEKGEKRLLLLGGEPIRVGERVAIYRRLPILPVLPVLPVRAEAEGKKNATRAAAVASSGPPRSASARYFAPNFSPMASTSSASISPVTRFSNSTPSARAGCTHSAKSTESTWLVPSCAT
jgi:glutathione synthase